MFFTKVGRIILWNILKLKEMRKWWNTLMFVLFIPMFVNMFPMGYPKIVVRRECENLLITTFPPQKALLNVKFSLQNNFVHPVLPHKINNKLMFVRRRWYITISSHLRCKITKIQFLNSAWFFKPNIPVSNNKFE